MTATSKVLYEAYADGKNGLTTAQVAAKHGVNPNTARRMISEYRRAQAQGISVGQLRDKRQLPERQIVELYPDTPLGIDPADLDVDDMREADIEELLELVRLSQRQMEKRDPVITHRTIEIEADGPVPILLAGCFQIGGRWTFHSFISRQLEEMFSLPNARLGTFGDEVENFMSGSFAGARSVYEQALTPPLQRVLWGHWLDKVADRVLWGTASQHGTQWNERTGHNPIKDKFMEHEIPFFDGMFYVKLKVGDVTYNIAGSHEFPGSSLYNKLHAQKRALWQRYPNADVLIQADKHQYAVAEEDAYGNEYLAGNRHSPYVWLVQVGTAKAGPDPYTIRGWERGVSEWPWMVLWPDQHKIKVTRHFEDVQTWVEQADTAPAALRAAA